MGSWLSRPVRDDRIEIDGMDKENKLPKYVRAPGCLDELIDWTISANNMLKDMEDTALIKFHPYIKASTIIEQHRTLSYVNQKQVEDFPGEDGISVFYIKNVVIVAETASPTDSTQRKSVLSVPDFCTYYILLRRYSELMDIGESRLVLSGTQCSICMGHAEEMVLPCMHSMCSSCARKWIRLHGDCPFCRHKYDDPSRMEKDQWQLQHWSNDSLQNDICNLEARLKSFWYKRGSYTPITADEWLHLEPSVKSPAENLTDDMVLIE